MKVVSVMQCISKIAFVKCIILDFIRRSVRS
nr:MAG TPA: hypothetical protein [Caudoviricetes sp.]